MLTKIEGCEKLLDLPDDEITNFRSLADAYSSQTIHLKLKQLMQTAEDLRFSLQPRLTLETAFISIIASGDVVGLTSFLSRLDTAIASPPAQLLELHQKSWINHHVSDVSTMIENQSLS